MGLGQEPDSRPRVIVCRERGWGIVGVGVVQMLKYDRVCGHIDWTSDEAQWGNSPAIPVLDLEDSSLDCQTRESARLDSS